MSASSPLKYVSPPSSAPAPPAVAAAADDAVEEEEEEEEEDDVDADIVAVAGLSSSGTGLVRAGSSCGWCTSRSRPFSDRYRSAASAAMQPEPLRNVCV